MFCAECGKQIVETAKHCVYCGTPVAPLEGDSGSEMSQPSAPAPAARVRTTPPPVPPAPFSATPPPPVPPAPGYSCGAVPPLVSFAPPPPPGYAAAGYAAAHATGRGALALRYAGAACFVLALVGSFLPFMTAKSIGGDADDAGASFMLWRDAGWGPVIGVIIALALICAVIPKRPTALIAALISLPAIALIPIRGSVYHGLEALGVNIGFGVGFFLLLAFTVVGCVLCFVAFVRTRKPAQQLGWGYR